MNDGILFASGQAGAYSHSPMLSWVAVNQAWVGLARRPRLRGADRLLTLGLIDAATRDAVALRWHYGQLIGNSDMHDGNLSFIPAATGNSPQLQLTPMYDMLPMRHAPRRGGGGAGCAVGAAGATAE